MPVVVEVKATSACNKFGDRVMPDDTIKTAMKMECRAHVHGIVKQQLGLQGPVRRSKSYKQQVSVLSERCVKNRKQSGKYRCCVQIRLVVVRVGVGVEGRGRSHALGRSRYGVQLPFNCEASWEGRGPGPRRTYCRVFELLQLPSPCLDSCAMGSIACCHRSNS